MDDALPPNPIIAYLLETFAYPIVFMYGAIVGSFLNVLIYRLPLRMAGQKIDIGGKSFCPRCNTWLKPWHNVPIFGFLFLGGRCAFCKVRISWRYFAVELLTACLWTAIFHAIGPRNLVGWTDFLFQALFVSVLVAMIFIDLDHFIAPDELNLTTVILGVGRDIACIAIAWMLSRTPGGTFFWEQTAPKYLATGWVPWAVPGALTYGLVLLAVSVAGFLYYAKVDWESTGNAFKRYFTFEDPPPPPDDYKMPEEEAPMQEESEEQEPVRLRLSVGIMALLSSLVLLPSAGWYAGLFFIVPLVAFFLISRVPDEAPTVTLARFFGGNDMAGLPQDALPVPENATEKESENSSRALEEKLQEEADQFAKEAETGSAGGMGMGDVKLAFGIGALLGPGLSLLSLLFATFLGALTGMLLAARYGKNLKLGVPFVPFMAAGAIIALLFGNAVIGWYLTVTGLNKTENPPPAVTRPIRPTP